MIGSFVCDGVGARSTIALFVTEGFGQGTVAAAAAATGGWVFKRHRGRYITEINGQRFVARSPQALEAMVAQWRKTHPANDEQPQKRKEVVQDRPAPRQPDNATPPVTLLAPGAERASAPPPIVLPILPPISPEQAQAALAAAMALQAHAEALQRELSAVLAQAEAEEDDDMEALLTILMEAA